MNTDRRSWILSVLSALPLMRFLKPTEEVTRGSNLICARCGNRRECTICEMTCSNCLGKRPSCSMCQGRYYSLQWTIPPDKKAELNQLGEGNIIDNKWGNCTTDIPDCLEVHKAFQKLTGEL